MCGIVGVIGQGGNQIAAMTGRLSHRGPDGEGFFSDAAANVHLGHRRLAVIDPDGGHQPMKDPSDRYIIVYNGMLYNAVALRDELESLGVRFRTSHSDTETVVAAFAQWGAACFARLNGMFALAIYDRTARRLWLARDPFGEKPLYIGRAPGVIAFASEPRAILTHPSFSADPDPASIQAFLAHGFFPGRRSYWRGITKLEGGHYAEIDPAGLECRETAFWNFRLEPDESLARLGEEALSEALSEKLASAVKQRLVSDVPLGLFLSGGVDSSAILAYGCDGLNAFTIGFDEASFDESAYAAQAAAVHGTRLHTRRLTMDDARAALPSLLGQLDEPMGDPSVLPTALLCRFAREQVTVALSGDGGDELFAGYDPLLAVTPARAYSRAVPAPMHRLLRAMADTMPVSSRNMSLEFKLKRSLRGLSWPMPLWTPVWLGPLDLDGLADVMAGHKPDIEETYAEALALWRGRPDLSPLERVMEFFTVFYLRDQILAKSDRASMLASLEVRAPFLDAGLVDFARRLPTRFKIARGQRKRILKRAVARRYPSGFFDRPKKGFGIPLAQWLRHWPEPDFSKLPTALDPERAAYRWRRHQSGQGDERLFLWAAVGMEKMIQFNNC